MPQNDNQDLKESSELFEAFVALHKERTGKAPSASDIKKFIELEHQKRNPLLYIERLHRSMPTAITLVFIALLLWLFTVVIQQKGAADGLHEMSFFMNSIPEGAWRLLQVMFGFWFARKAGLEILDRWPGRGRRSSRNPRKVIRTPARGTE